MSDTPTDNPNVTFAGGAGGHAVHPLAALQPPQLPEGLTPAQIDGARLEQALALAELGRCGARPNPVVGAVLAAGDDVLSSGYHARYGELHAERAALAALPPGTQLPPDATLYVSLEPCAHQGRQPPCVDAIIEAGIQRVVIAVADSNPQTAGQGPRRLLEAGIKVAWGPADIAHRAAQQNAGFHSVHRRGRPYVTYKWAQTRNGRLATGDPDRRWVSGDESREIAHYLRAGSGAIAVGVETVLADDPQLTVRGAVADLVSSPPLRVIYDRTLRTPLTCNVVATAADTPTLIITAHDAPADREQALRAAGVDVWRAPDGEPAAFLPASLAELAARGVNDLLLESGPRLANAFHLARLVDALICFVAPFDAPADQPGFEPTHAFLQATANATQTESGDDTIATAVLTPMLP